MLPGLYPRGTRGEGAVRYRSPEEQNVAELWFFSAVVANFLVFSPELLMVDTSAYQPGFRGARFDYLGYFSQDPRFARAFWQYRPIGGLRSLLLYKREANAVSIPTSGADRAHSAETTPATCHESG